MRLYKVKKDIVVVGLYQSGKTVFLTSLINHLKDHHQDLFKIGQGRAQLYGFQYQKPKSPWQEFPYERFREQLVHKYLWPDKSCRPMQCRCTLKRSDWKNSFYELSFSDFPGERLADASMMGQDFWSWSSLVLEHLQSNQETMELAKDYLQLLQESPEEESRLIKAYKTTLSRLWQNYLPMISPSSFIVDPKGRFLPQENREANFKKGICGLDPQSEFSPLPVSFKDLHPEMGKRFERAFEAYSKKLVQPIFDWMAQAGHLVVLVDLSTILAAGVGMYNTNLKLLELLFSYLSPGRKSWTRYGAFFSRSLSLGWFRLFGITRVAVVATKIDKIHASQRQKALFLLRDMLEKMLREYNLERSLSLEYFTCAAVRATSSEEENLLKGRLQKFKGEYLDPEQAPFFEYKASELPEKWPKTWEEGDFCFPNVLPAMPRRKDRPPEHLNLDLIADFLLKKDKWYE